ncbi:MAG TPA: hypothetical protein DCG41_10455 [Verrucomicrobiales bacterium]|nr:hypothetical protein [Verrucomicrobiales bacterium]
MAPGESNKENPEAYFKQLTTLVEDLRKDLSMPELTFIDGQVNGNKGQDWDEE